MAKIVKLPEIQKSNTKLSISGTTQNICTEIRHFFEKKSSKTTIFDFAVVEFCRVLDDFPFLIKNEAVFTQI